MPAASYSLLLNLKKGLFFAIGEGSRIFVACFLHSSAQICLYLTPGRPRTTGLFVNTAVTTVQISWRCWFCRSMSIEDPESRRFELTPKVEFFSGRSWPNICSGIMLPFFLKVSLVRNFFCKIFVLIVGDTTTLWRVFEVHFFCQHRVSIVIGLKVTNKCRAV